MKHLPGNFRVYVAIEAVRIDRNAATMSELYDALNARRRARDAELTRLQLDRLNRAYLAQNAPDLLRFLPPVVLPLLLALGLLFAGCSSSPPPRPSVWFHKSPDGSYAVWIPPTLRTNNPPTSKP